MRGTLIILAFMASQTYFFQVDCCIIDHSCSVPSILEPSYYSIPKCDAVVGIPVQPVISNSISPYYPRKCCCCDCCRCKPKCKCYVCKCCECCCKKHCPCKCCCCDCCKCDPCCCDCCCDCCCKKHKPCKCCCCDCCKYDPCCCEKCRCCC